MSLFAQRRNNMATGIATQEVSRRVLSITGMNIQLSCPWCTDEVTFTIDAADEEMQCTACGTRMDLAPDTGVTFELLYAPAA